MSVQDEVALICGAAKRASRTIASASTKTKNEILASIAEKLSRHTPEILAENEKDLSFAKDAGMSLPMLDRLCLTDARIDGMVSSLSDLCRLEDPIGKGEEWVRPSGIRIHHVRAPLGVCGMIYEARPNVTVDAAAMCLKTGNAAVLRGGKEAIFTNRFLVGLMRDAVKEAGIEPDVVSLISDTTRESATALMKMRGLIDVLIPRGSRGLIQAVVREASVPVIETGAGNCHLYIDESADLEKAVRIAVNAKCSRPSVCNAIETLLVHASVAERFLPALNSAFLAFHPVELRGCERTRRILPEVAPVTEEDYETEYDDYILAVRVVDSIDDAIAHINRYSTGHSEAIVTDSVAAATRFQSEIDSACVYVNASTRFTDGGEFGFGAEIGISTQKLHARGPMGLLALTTDKYLISGDGSVR